MKRFFRILPLAFIYLLSSSKSCSHGEQTNADREEAIIRITRDSLRSAFESDTLSASMLHAFEDNARMKFTDFADYMKILGDSSIAPEFRDHTRELTRDLFISENTPVKYFAGPAGSLRVKTLNDLLLAGQWIRGSSCRLTPDSVHVISPLQRTSDSIFRGRLGFSVSFSHATSRKPATYWPVSGTIDFFVAKREKNFGNDTLKIWSVFLGEMSLF